MSANLNKSLLVGRSPGTMGIIHSGESNKGGFR